MQRMTSTRRSFSARSGHAANRQEEVQVERSAHGTRSRRHASSHPAPVARSRRTRRKRHPSSVAVSACCAAAVAGSVAFAMAAGASSGQSRGTGRVDVDVLNDVALARALVPVETRDGLTRDPQGRATTTKLSVATQLAAEQEQRLAAESASAAQQQQEADARRARDAVWDRLAQCETAGNWSMQGSRFSGGLGFYNGTWNDFGGREFAANAGMATREQQIVVAERVRARFGYTGWGCAPKVGLL